MLPISYYKALIEKQKKTPRRKALSLRFPILAPIILRIHQYVKRVRNSVRCRIARKKKDTLLPFILARHQSVLMRKLGTSDRRLQEQKIINIRRAIQNVDGILIRPGETWSLFETIGKPTEKRGYVNGMLLSQGKVIEGIGGGLCQLSNLLCWLFLHTPLTITERYHHSYDVFPDSGRVLPFGSGATCMYNTIDLQVKNNTPYTYQVHLFLTENHLKGHIRCQEKEAKKETYSIEEREHVFIQHQHQFFRHNILYRIRKHQGTTINEEQLWTNCAPVLYKITAEYLQERGYELITLP